MPSDSNNDDDRPEVATRLNFGRKERKVGLTEVKTYSCLYLILDDLETLLKMWKERTRHPAHVRYTENAEVSERMNLGEAKLDMFLDLRFRMLAAKDQDVVISSLCFLEVFKDEQSFIHMLVALRCMKRQILQIMLPTLNNLFCEERFNLEIWESLWPFVADANKSVKHKLNLKINFRQGDEAVLENDLITSVFGSAANFVQVVMGILFLAGSFQHSQLVAFVSKVRHMMNDLKCKFSALVDLVGEEQDEDGNIFSLLKRAHYTVRQLQFRSYENREEGSMVICGQSDELLIAARNVRDKVILTLWNKVEKRVASTIPLCNFGCDGVLAFVIQEKLFIAMLGSLNPGYFFFFVMQCDIDTNGSNHISDTNAWPHPVIMREVATNGICRKVVFHMFKEDSGDVVWLAVIQDDAGTQVAFFDSASGTEVGRDEVLPKCADLQAIKDNKAIFLDHDKGMFTICEFKKRSLHTLVKLSVNTLLLLPEVEQKQKYTEEASPKAAFDLYNNCFVLVSPRGERVFLDADTLEVKSTVKTPLSDPMLKQAFKIGVSMKEEDSCRRQDYFRMRRRRHSVTVTADLGLQKHCLIDGILFYLSQDKEACFLRALDLHSDREGGNVATIDICGFAKCQEDSVQLLLPRRDIISSKLLPKGRGCHFVPYAFAKDREVFEEYSKNCISHMWTLMEGGEYRLHYCRNTETLFIGGTGDGNFVEVKFLHDDVIGGRGKVAAEAVGGGSNEGVECEKGC